MHNIKPYILYYGDVAADTDMKYIDLILSKVGIHPNTVTKERILSKLAYKNIDPFITLDNNLGSRSFSV